MNRIISFYPLENRPTLLLDLSGGAAGDRLASVWCAPRPARAAPRWKCC
jgi:hypothetical protein